MKVDLHLHSHFSDGALPPPVLAEECHKVGLELVALTDHDSVAGIPEWLETGAKLGLKTIPGIEISAEYNGAEYHLLGYCIDWQSAELKSTLARWQIDKATQVRQMVDNLRNLSPAFQVDFDEVKSMALGSIDKANITRAVFGNGKNEAILQHYGIKAQGDFFKKFLKEESPNSVFAPMVKPDIKEAIQVIKNANGLAVWAHAFWKGGSPAKIKKTAKILKGLGLDGLEVCYSLHTYFKTRALHAIAKDLDMLETAGSDFHSRNMYMLNKIADFKTFGVEINLNQLLARQ